ncbi:MAG: c-type cytochrome [Deltaproteobacteria bacterium]|nr:c-type cytochrome [Deltaproteobacteria bacterium]
MDPNAAVRRGGALYDAWWSTLGVAPPTGEHPLWASRPDPMANTRTGRDTWRCKECHGWDYRGVDGAYGSGDHRTGIRGILGTRRTEQELVTLLRESAPGPSGGHGYGARIPEAELRNVARFVLQGTVDTTRYVDAMRRFQGDATRGGMLFRQGVGGVASCGSCHGDNGLTDPPMASMGFDDFPGAVARGNPWEFLHKVRFGQPGYVMPPLHGRANEADLRDLGAFAQTLPMARP